MVEPPPRSSLNKNTKYLLARYLSQVDEIVIMHSDGSISYQGPYKSGTELVLGDMLKSNSEQRQKQKVVQSNKDALDDTDSPIASRDAEPSTISQQGISLFNRYVAVLGKFNFALYIFLCILFIGVFIAPRRSGYYGLPCRSCITELYFRALS